MLGASGLFRLLGDDVRLRLLRLLAAERLNVSELTSILGIAQSGVSRHLGLLRDAGLVREQREGGFAYYHPARGPSGKFEDVWPLVRAQLEDERAADPGADSPLHEDDARLQAVRRQRREHRETHGAGAPAGGVSSSPGEAGRPGRGPWGC